jgi:hypothetical protein
VALTEPFRCPPPHRAVPAAPLPGRVKLLIVAWLVLAVGVAAAATLYVLGYTGSSCTEDAVGHGLTDAQAVLACAGGD